MFALFIVLLALFATAAAATRPAESSALQEELQPMRILPDSLPELKATKLQVLREAGLDSSDDHMVYYFE